MLNDFTIIGTIIKIENEIVTIASVRDYKNENGFYEHDIIPITIHGIDISKFEFGDRICVKGTMQNVDCKKPVVLQAKKIHWLA